jgi:hypothetical protein
MPIGGGYIHDAAVFLRQHHAKFVFHAQQCAEHIRIERRRVALGSLLHHRAGHAFRTGGVHRDIQTAIPFHGLVDQVAHVLLAAYIGADELRFRTVVADFTDQLLASSSRRPETTTRAPSLANARAVARPIPVSAPVIKTYPANLCPLSGGVEFAGFGEDLGQPIG